MIVNKCSENLLTKSKKLYENYRDNCIVVQRMLEKYKKIYSNISDYSIMHFIDIAEFCDLIMDRQKLEDLNGDECYCLLMAALFAHTGFGLNQESMNKYIASWGSKSRRSRFIPADHEQISCFVQCVSDRRIRRYI